MPNVAESPCVDLENCVYELRPWVIPIIGELASCAMLVALSEPGPIVRRVSPFTITERPGGGRRARVVFMCEAAKLGYG